LSYGVMAGVNVLVPWGLSRFGKVVANVDEFGNIVESLGVAGRKGITVSDEIDNIIDVSKTNIREDITPRSVDQIQKELNYPTGYKLKGDTAQTQTEVYVNDIVQKTDSYRIRRDKLTDEWQAATHKLTNNPTEMKKGYKAMNRYVIEELRDLKTISSEEQIEILNAFDRVSPANQKRLYDTVSDSLDVHYTTKAGTRTPRQMAAVRERIASRLETMEDNLNLGLSANATKADRTLRAKEIEALAQKHIKTLVSDEVLSASRAGIKKSMEELVKDPASNAMTHQFAKGDAFNIRFPQAMAYMHQIDDPVLRADTLNTVYTQLLKESDVLDRSVQASIKYATSRAKPQGLEDTERIVSLIEKGLPIRPEEFDSLRPILASFITKRLRDHLIIPDNQGTIRTSLAKLNEELKHIGKDENLIKGVIAKQEQLKNQYIQQISQDPNMVKQLANSMGDHELAQAVDLHYATLGDPNAAASLIVRRNQNPLRTQTDIVLQDLHNNPTGTSSRVGGNEHVIDPPEREFVQEKDLNIFRRMLGSLDVGAEQGLKYAKTSAGKQVFRDVKRWLDRAITVRNEFLTDLNVWTREKLQPFYDYTGALDDQSRRATYHALDTVAQGADDRLKAGRTFAEVEEWIREYTHGLSPAAKKGYDMYRSMTDDLYDNVNAAIRQHNSLVNQGIRKGSLIDEVEYRPGYMPYFYEGSYEVNWTHVNGSQMTQMVHNRKEAMSFLQSIHDGGQLQGRISLRPLIMEDVEDAIQFTTPGQSLEDLFGIDGKELNDLFANKKITDKNLHQVFWGSKLSRRLSLHDQKIDTDTALNMAARFSFRFKHYAPLYQEGQLLIKDLDRLGLENWRDAIKVYGNDLLGRSRDSEALLEKKIRSVIDLVTDNVPASAGLLKSWGYSPRGRVVRGVSSGLTMAGRMMALGFNPATALVQWFILPTNVAPVIGFGNIVRGMRELASIRNTKEFATLMQRAGLHINPANIGMAERLDLPKALTTRLSRTTNFLDWASMYMFNGSENTIRASTILGARRHGKDIARSMQSTARSKWTWQQEMLHDVATELGKPVTNADVLDQYAIKIMRRTNFDFDITGLSELSRNPVLKPFMQFKTYFLKEYEMLFGGGLPLTAKERLMSLAMFTTIGGAFALPFADELDQLSTYAFGFSPRLWVMQNMPEMASTGIGGVIGIDMAGKANIGSLTRAFSNNFFGVAPSKVGTQLNSYMQGNAGALDAMTGSFSFLKGIGQTKELLQTGRVSDKYGQTLATSEQIGTGGAIAMALGLPPKSLARAMTLSNLSHRLDEKQKVRDRAGLRLYYEAKAKGNMKEADRIKEEYELSNRQLKAYADKVSRTPHETLEKGMSTKTRKSRDGEDMLELME